MKHKEKRYHPTQKPVGLLLQIIEKYSKQGDVILDPFCGSGSVLVAAQKLGHEYIGIDNYAPYIEVTNNRLNIV